MSDETTRSATDQTLRNHLERLVNTGSYEWDMRTGRVTWSRQLYRVLGRDPADGPMPIADLPALVRPADVVATARAAAWVVERGRTLEVTCPVLVNGRIRHLRAVVEPVHDLTGRLVRVRGVVRDVSVPVPSTGQWSPPPDGLDGAAADRMAARMRRVLVQAAPPPADLGGLRVEARATGTAGGSWFHRAALDDGRVLLAVGDVDGEGLPAVGTMANLRAWLISASARMSDPARLLDALNSALVGSGTDRTATALVARWDPLRCELAWARAGHPPPVLRRAGGCRELAGPGDRPLGTRRAANETSTAVLGAGDAVLFYTAEAVGGRGGRHAVRALRDLPTDHDAPLLPGLLADLTPADGPAAEAGSPAAPGSTAAAGVRGAVLLAVPRRVEPDDVPAGAVLLLTRGFDRDGLDGTRADVLARGTDQGLSELALFNFTLAVTEVVTNAVRHGGDTGHLRMWRAGEDLLVEVVDHGCGIPAARRVPRGPQPGQVGGWGLWLARQICASVDIHTGQAGTRVLLRYPLPH